MRCEREGTIALSWLSFDPRIEFVESISRKLAAGLTLPESEVDDIVSVLRARFEEEYLSANRTLSREDLQAIFKPMLRSAGQKGLIGWLRLLRSLFGIEITVSNNEPLVALTNVSAWHLFTKWLDGDALILLCLCEQGRGAQIDRLTRWHLIPRIADHDLNVLLERGISDMHLHLGGLRSAHLIWLHMLAGHYEPERLDYFRPRSWKASGIDEAEQEHRRREAQRIRMIGEVFRGASHGGGDLWLGDSIGRGWIGTAPAALAALPPLDARWIPHLLAAERAMIANAIDRLINIPSHAPSQATARADQLLGLGLDFYISVKSAFLFHHRQAVHSNPGLSRHRQLSDTTKLWSADDKSLRSKLARKRAFGDRRFSNRRALRHADAAYYLAQSDVLKRLELRFAPEPTAVYRRFLDDWGVVERLWLPPRLRSGPNGPDATTSGNAVAVDADWQSVSGNFGQLDAQPVRFAIHFKRSLDRRKGEDPFLVFLGELDSDSANFHEFRLGAHEDWLRATATAAGHKGRPHPAARFARVDFAGQERDIFPAHVAFTLRLLRGDADAIAKLTSSSCDRQLHQRWLALVRDGRAYPPVGLPELGVTCHAGEDYAHPLEGIHAMMTAADALRMKAGDTLGHGLAIGRDIKRFHDRHGADISTRAGAQFDALVWLYHLLSEKAPPGFSHFAQQIANWVHDIAPTLYPKALLSSSLHPFNELAELRAGPIPGRGQMPSASPSEQMWFLECWGPKRSGNSATNPREARDKTVPLAEILFRIEEVITWAQAHVAMSLSDRGIILEFNPSSNWRMSQADSPGEIPFVEALRRYKSALQTCINTDNAAAYGTRIETEYAIAMQALREQGWSRREALAQLEEMRRTGMVGMK